MIRTDHFSTTVGFLVPLGWCMSAANQFRERRAYELRGISLPCTPLNEAKMVAPSLRVVALTNRVVERRHRYIDGKGACGWLPGSPQEGTTTSPIR